jgi:hypothetical protein
VTAFDRAPSLSLVRPSPSDDPSTMPRSAERVERATGSWLRLVKDGVEIPADARVRDVFQRWSRTGERLDRLCAMLEARPWRITARDFSRLTASTVALRCSIVEDREGLASQLASFADVFFAERVIDFDLTIDRFEAQARRALASVGSTATRAALAMLILELRALVRELDRCLPCPEPLRLPAPLLLARP